MPFKAPYRNKYNLGDLIYGLKKIRNIYIDNHASFETLKKNPHIICLIDEYAVTETKRQKQKIGRALTPENQDEFLQYLQNHSNYSSAYNPESFEVKLKRENLSLSFTKPLDTVRKCKAGLDWSSQNGKFTVHFLLDGISISDVIFKTSEQDVIYATVEEYLRAQTASIPDAQFNSDYPEYNLTGKSITGSELRWIYRNRDKKSVQKTIQFWYTYKACCPPWDPDFDKIYGNQIAYLWENYVPKYCKSRKLLSRERRAVFNLASLFSCIGLYDNSEPNSLRDNNLDC